MFDGNILRTFATLSVLVALFGVLFWIIKKYTAKSKKNTTGVSIEILSKMSLQPKNQLFVIKAGDKTLLLGVSEKSITNLADLSDEFQPKPNFESVLNQAKNQNVRPNAPQQIINDESLSFRSFLMSTISKS